MKVKVRYICETCHTDYMTEEEALQCEARGKPVPIPVGTIFTMGGINGFYKDIHFSIAINRQEKVGHGYHPALRACRENTAGDSLEQFCGGGNSVRLGKGDKPVQSHVTFIRMVKYLRSIKIQPRKWNGKESVGYEG
jgi:hypothetical protein